MRPRILTDRQQAALEYLEAKGSVGTRLYEVRHHALVHSRVVLANLEAKRYVQAVRPVPRSPRSRWFITEAGLIALHAHLRIEEILNEKARA